MNNLTDMQKLRDELALKKFDDEGYTNKRSVINSTYRNIFKSGFDAAQAEFLKRESVLKDALEFYANKAFSDEEEMCGFFKPWMSDKGRRAVLALNFLDEKGI